MSHKACFKGPWVVWLVKLDVQNGPRQEVRYKRGVLVDWTPAALSLSSPRVVSEPEPAEGFSAFQACVNAFHPCSGESKGTYLKMAKTTQFPIHYPTVFIGLLLTYPTSSSLLDQLNETKPNSSSLVLFLVGVIEFPN